MTFNVRDNDNNLNSKNKSLSALQGYDKSLELR